MSSLPFNEKSEAEKKMYGQIKRGRWGILRESLLPPVSVFLSKPIHALDRFGFGLGKKPITANNVIYIKMMNRRKRSTFAHNI